MTLAILDLTILSTPSGIIDGHFPSGDDGSGAIPLTWSSIPPQTQKQEGSPYSIDLFANFLTQPGGSTASLTPGSSLGTGWSLTSGGVLNFSGTGIASGTIRVRATHGTDTSDSPFFNYSSIAHTVGSDTQAPTKPTGLTVLSKTTTSITVSVDAPSDVPTAATASSGMQGVNFLKAGVLDGSQASMAAGLSVRFSRVDYSAPIQRFVTGNFVSIAEDQRNNAVPPGVPSATADPTTGPGPCRTGVSALLHRIQWKDLESAQGVYTWAMLDNVIKQAGPDRVALGFPGISTWLMIINKTFSTNVSKNFNDARGLTSVTLTTSLTNGSYGFQFSTGEARNVVVTGGTNASWASDPRGALANGGTAVTTAQTNTLNHNPMPGYLQQYAEVFSSNTGGWQGYRWPQPVLNAFDNLMKAIGIRYDANPWFAGVATQETSLGGRPSLTSGYSTAAYNAGLKAESDSITRWIRHGRHLYYFNFMAGGGTPTETNAIQEASLTDVAQHIALNNAWLGGPDLVMVTGGVNTRCYNTMYLDYHSGVNGMPRPGLTFCSMQNAEWSGIPPSDNGTPRAVLTLYQYGRGLTADDAGTVVSSTNPAGGKPLRLDGWTVDYHPSVTGPNGFQKYDPAATDVFVNHNQADGTWGGTVVPPAAIPAGTLSQNGVDWDLTSFGLGNEPTADNWSVGSVSVNADRTIIVNLDSITGSNTTAAFAGISFRETQAFDARTVNILVTTTNLRACYRPTPGANLSDIAVVAGQSWASPKWLKIKRVGNIFTCYWANNDHSWTQMGSPLTLAMVPNVFVEILACSAKATAIVAHFKQVNIQSLADVQHTYSGLSTGTSYNLSASSTDLSLNTSLACSTVAVTTN